MIRARGFTDHVDGSYLFLDLCDELAVARFRIGKPPTITFEGYHENVFGDIDSEVADLSLHAIILFLGFTSSAGHGCLASGSGNCSSSNLKSSDRSSYTTQSLPRGRQ